MEDFAQVCPARVVRGDALKQLSRDKSLFLAHVLVSTVLGVFCGVYSTDPITFLLLVLQLSHFQAASTTKLASPLPDSNRELDVYSSWLVLWLDQIS